MAFATFLAVAIISGIVNIGLAVVNSITDNTIVSGTKKRSVDYSESFTGVESLDIENSTGTLSIKIGDEFRVEAEKVSEDFKAEVSKSGKLTVKEDNNGISFLWFNTKGFNSFNSKVTIYVPRDFVAEEVKLNTGAGNVVLEGLNTDYLYLSAGAGNIDGDRLIAKRVNIDGGVGNIKLTNVDFTNSSYECGIGNLKIEGALLGKTEIDCGVGEVDLDLEGNKDDYSFDVDAGVGSVRLNGEKIGDIQRHNEDAKNTIKIDAGVGSVNIDIKE